jgi:integrase
VYPGASVEFIPADNGDPGVSARARRRRKHEHKQQLTTAAPQHAGNTAALRRAYCRRTVYLGEVPMPKRATPLTAAKVAKTAPGCYCDGGGLYLTVRSAEARSWTFRYTSGGRVRQCGLGPAGGTGAVPLADARERAAELRRLVRSGVDPLARRQAEKAASARAVTFAEALERYLAAHAHTWRSVKHRAIWSASMASYVLPALGRKPVVAITKSDVISLLQASWRDKPETASRARGRIEAVLDYSEANGWRSGENPARWKGRLEHALPHHKRGDPQHHAAMDWTAVGAFLVDLRAVDGVAERCLEFAVLTAARAGEVLGATWSEIDLQTGVWTVPGGRMKAGRQHRVPLSDRALAILHMMMCMRDQARGDLVFARARGLPLGEAAMRNVLRRLGYAHTTVHGFRSAFRDWCAEMTAYPREVAETALAHVVGNAVERAYARGDMFTKRVRLMTEWSAFCSQPHQPAEVVPLRAVG